MDQRRGKWVAPSERQWRRVAFQEKFERLMWWLYGSALYLLTTTLAGFTIWNHGYPEIAALVVSGLSVSAAIVARRVIKDSRK